MDDYRFSYGFVGTHRIITHLLTHWNAFLAFFRPGFLRSTDARIARQHPRFFSAGLKAGSYSCSALGDAVLTACACPDLPPPRTIARTSNSPIVLVTKRA